MQHIKKFLLLLSICIISIMLPHPVSAANAITAKSETELVQVIYEQMLSHKQKFQITYYGDYSKLDISEIINLVYEKDDPQTSDDYDYLRWSVNKYECNASYTKVKADIKFQVNYLETTKQQKKVNTAIQSALKEMTLSKKSDVTKIKAIHDYIVNLFTYDQSYQKYSAYSGLIDKNHSTVCQGYALTTYKMLKEVGINSIIVEGDNHAWNLVQLGNKWYHLDTTWDDPISSKPILRYHYFLLGSNSISKDHHMTEETLQRLDALDITISKSNYDLSKTFNQKTLNKIASSGGQLKSSK